MSADALFARALLGRGWPSGLARREPSRSYQVDDLLLQLPIHHVVGLPRATGKCRSDAGLGIAEELEVELKRNALALLSQGREVVARQDLDGPRQIDLTAVDGPYDPLQGYSESPGNEQRPFGCVPALDLRQDSIVHVQYHGHCVDDSSGQEVIERRNHEVRLELIENLFAIWIVQAAHPSHRHPELFQHSDGPPPRFG